MIYSVNGKLIHKDSELAVVECGGVGYACRTTFSTLSKIGAVGSDAFLLTYLHVREDNVELFGFADMQELNCFKLLISVSGVGPKVGLAILSDCSPTNFALYVATGDFKAITKTKGVGPKLAQRVILELKDKIAKNADFSEASSVDYSAVSAGGSTSDAVSALVVLGYSQSEAVKVVAKFDKSLPTEELIRLSLKEIAKNM